MNEAVRKAIIDIKLVKEQRGISCQQICDICEENGEYIGISTIRRIFLPGSEDKTTNHRPRTLNAILHAVLGTDNNALSKAESAALSAVAEMNEKVLSEKDDTIRSLTRDLEDTKLQLKTVTEMFRLAMESLGKSISN